MAAQEFVLDQLEPTAAVPDVEDLLAVVAAARAEADQIRAQAREEGLAQGRAEGEAAARAESQALLQPALQALAAASDALAAERAEVAARVERQAVELALELAGKVVAGAVEAQPERVLDVVRGALRCLVERERVQVLVHPEDLAIVRESMDRLRGELGGIDHVEVQEERRLGRGGAIVRTPDAEIDADLRTKLERAREAIVAELREAS
jgi:flagellar biosynthesis/type III secretory pathway protein FliH